jgi:hypothetical protein
MGITIFSYHHLSPWAWWLPIVAGMSVALALSYPNSANTKRESALSIELPDEAGLHRPSYQPLASFQ